MQFKRAVQLSLRVAMLCAVFGAGVRADTWDKKTIVTFSESVEIPGQVLPAGTYVFKLANTVSDRHIVQIWTEDETHILATIIAIPNYRLELSNRPMFEFDERPGNSPMALRSWFHPGDKSGQEFVYPRYR
jgi:hypothetical protein